MLRFILKRLLSALPTLFILVVLAFFLIRFVPGGPFDTERHIPPEVLENLKEAYNLNGPLHQQFADYVKGLLRGDLGPSIRYQDSTVSELIAAGFPVSLRIGLLAMVFAVAIGAFAGAVAALRKGTFSDVSIMATALLGLSIPSFVIAPLLILVFAVYLGWLPAGGLADGSGQYLIMPVATLALPQIAYIARLMRASLIEVLNSDFIRTARAKGLPRHTVLLRHALRPALIPLVSYLGPATAGVITGSLVVEQIFQLPGIGRYFVDGALNRDYTLVMGVIVFYGALIILFNLLVDLVYAWLDPKLRYR
ncbi:MAG: oligopeptide ABC transporter permease OppB [Gammaproteobacteria bacterium]